MIAATYRDHGSARLVAVGAGGTIRHISRRDLPSLFEPGDLLVANDAATLPASLRGTMEKDGSPIEVRLAAWVRPGDVTEFVAVVFGPGDHRTRTEHRPLPPRMSAGDRLLLGPLVARVEGDLGHPRLVLIRFLADRRGILQGLARHGRPIQYAHVPTPLGLEAVWTALAAEPVAFEPPSAGFALDWDLISALRRRGIAVLTVTHAAGISSTGDPQLDRRLPFDEPYSIPERTAAAVRWVKGAGGRVIAVGTTVVRAIESASTDGVLKAGSGVATGRIDEKTTLRTIDAVITGIHQPGESHFELLRAFASDNVLDRAAAAVSEQGYRSHEFGDFMLIERKRIASQPDTGTGLTFADLPI